MQVVEPIYFVAVLLKIWDLKMESSDEVQVFNKVTQGY